MPDPSRLLTAPLRVAGGLRLEHLVTMACADALVRYGRACGRHVTWECATLAGDLAGQYEVERELAREGQDRTTVSSDEFIERVRAYESAARDRAGKLMQALGMDVDLEAGALDQAKAVIAARTAFVRLYEAGLLSFSERVVESCPRCVTAVDLADSDPIDLPGDVLVLRLLAADDDAGLDSYVDVMTLAPELLPAAVAVLVPEGHPATNMRVEVPLAGRAVRVVAFDVDAPVLAVPAHDSVAYDAARRLAISPIELLDPEGVVHHDGPLSGLGRYAARAAARELLEAEGVIVDVFDGVESVFRCRRCRTVLIPRLGRHWTMSAAPLELAAADAVREGQLSFSPPAAREQFLLRAGQGGEWCVSYQVLAGQSVPAATCLDCGHLAVTVQPATSCPRCMGTLSPDMGVLDARFVGAVWPLAAAGWPDESVSTLDLADTALIVGPGGLAGWALTMAAMGLRLAGVTPFSQVIVSDLTADADDGEPGEGAVEMLVATEGPEVVRMALLAGGLDTVGARELMDLFVARSPAGDDDGRYPTAFSGSSDRSAPAIARWEAIEAAFAAGRLGDVFAMLTSALSEGPEIAEVGDMGVLAGVLLGKGTPL